MSNKMLSGEIKMPSAYPTPQEYLITLVYELKLIDLKLYGPIIYMSSKENRGFTQAAGLRNSL